MENKKTAKKIIMFYGEECPDCHRMHPVVDKLISDGQNIEKLEVWHDKKNAKKMMRFEKLIRASCQGNMEVPCFFNKKKREVLCGEISYESLKSWINKK